MNSKEEQQAGGGGKKRFASGQRDCMLNWILFWIERRLSHVTLQGAAAGVTEAADGCLLPAVGKTTATLTAAGLQVLNR